MFSVVVWLHFQTTVTELFEAELLFGFILNNNDRAICNIIVVWLHFQTTMTELFVAELLFFGFIFKQ